MTHDDTTIDSPDEAAPATLGADDTAGAARPAEGRRPPRGGPRPDRPKRRDVNGWVILDKGVGMTSTHAVAVVKRAFNAKKAGHAGTLDPLASGILPIALGEATKTVPFVMDGRKAYVFTVTWGIETDTDDAEGRPVATSDTRPERAAVEAALPRFIGAIEQVPPRYSAIKIAGERAYDLARDGEVVELVARPVQIDHLAVVEHDGQRTVIEAQCGKGTYVRALARDLGRFAGRQIEVPALFVAGRSDWGPFQAPGVLEIMGERASTHFHGRHFVEGAGHWVQQEQPQAVTELLLEFLRRSAAGTDHRT